MLFSPEERILLLNCLPPAEGSAIFLRSVRSLRGKLAFSEEEIRVWKIQARSPQPGASAFSWNPEVARPVEIEVSPNAAEYVKNCLTQADAAGRLHEGLMGVYDSLFPEE